jgi:hypothetical protein
MHRYTIIRRVTPLVSGDYACTVMAVRQDPGGKNEFDVKICATLAEAENTCDAIERRIREQVEARGGVIAESSETSTA